MMGVLTKIKERNFKMVTRTVTAKAEEKSIRLDDHIPPPGHSTFVKKKVCLGGEVSAQLISIGGVRMQDGQTWQTASCIMSRTIKVNEDGLTLGDLSHLKSFQLTSSHKNRTTKGSVLPNLTNSASVDLSDEIYDSLDIVMYGGQFVDKITTSGEVLTI